MAGKSKIHWTDATWQPVTGCSVISAGCKNCYAMKLAGGRLRHHPSRAGLTDPSAAGPVWNGTVRLNEDWLDQPLKWQAPRRIFVCAHGDLFHDAVPDDWIDTVFQIMDIGRRHTFQVLTKRPERMRDFMTDHPEWRLPNVWLGVSAEDAATAAARIPVLMETPAAIRWVSYEPALGPVDFSPWMPPVVATWCDGGPESPEIRQLLFAAARGARHRDPDPVPGIDWIVAGGESGAQARPAHPDWYRAARDVCARGAVPFFFKQWGRWMVGKETTDNRFGLPLVYGDGATFDVASDGADIMLSTAEDHRGPPMRIWKEYWASGDGRLLRLAAKSDALPALDGYRHGEFPA